MELHGHGSYPRASGGRIHRSRHRKVLGDSRWHERHCRAASQPGEVRGRHLLTGLPTAVQLSSGEVRSAVAPALNEILQAIRDTLEETPPELSSDIAKGGILLAGGGTLVRGFQELVAEETGMPVFSAESPLTCVVYGSGQALDHLDKLAHTSRNRRPSRFPCNSQ